MKLAIAAALTLAASAASADTIRAKDWHSTSYINRSLIVGEFFDAYLAAHEGFTPVTEELRVSGTDWMFSCTGDVAATVKPDLPMFRVLSVCGKMWVAAPGTIEPAN